MSCGSELLAALPPITGNSGKATSYLQCRQLQQPNTSPAAAAAAGQPHDDCLQPHNTRIPQYSHSNMTPGCLRCQVPNLDATVSVKASLATRGVPKSLRMLLAGLMDLLRTSVGRAPLYLPLAGPYGSLAFMQVGQALVSVTAVSAGWGRGHVPCPIHCESASAVAVQGHAAKGSFDLHAGLRGTDAGLQQLCSFSVCLIGCYNGFSTGEPCLDDAAGKLV